MTAREIIKKRIAHEGTDETPYSVVIEPELLQRLNVYYGNDRWYYPLLKQYTVSFLNVDTVKLYKIDDTHYRDAIGAIWRTDKLPWFIEYNPLIEPAFKNYKFPDSTCFTTPILENKVIASEQYDADGEHFRIINMGWGIFETFWRLRGFENALMDMLLEEDFCFEATREITRLYLEMVRACADVPADAYLFGDDWGDQRGIIMGIETWRKFIKPCWARIYEEVHRQNKIVIQHSCGSICDIYNDLIEIGMDVHESVQPEAHGMAPEIIKAQFGDRLSFWGCLGSQGILTHGTPGEIRTEIFRLANLFKESGGYVLSPSKSLPNEMPVEKAIAVINALHDINEK